MELASNLIWACVTLLLLLTALRAARQRITGVSTWAALLLTLLICMMLLPVVSITDDILMSRQAALPLSAQSWRLAAGDSSLGLDLLPLLGLLLLFLGHAAGRGQRLDTSARERHPHTVWLTRSLRLRPPPALSL